MKIALWTVAVIYGVGFLGALALNLGSGPVTLGLSVVRAVVWPLWVATGKPEGQRLPMD